MTPLNEDERNRLSGAAHNDFLWQCLALVTLDVNLQDHLLCLNCCLVGKGIDARWFFLPQPTRTSAMVIESTGGRIAWNLLSTLLSSQFIDYIDVFSMKPLFRKHLDSPLVGWVQNDWEQGHLLIARKSCITEVVKQCLVIQMMQAWWIQKPDSIVKYPDISCWIVEVQTGSEVCKVSRVRVHSNHLKQGDTPCLKRPNDFLKSHLPRTGFS